MEQRKPHAFQGRGLLLSQEVMPLLLLSCDRVPSMEYHHEQEPLLKR